MIFSSSRASLLDAALQARRHDPVYVLSAACPLCHGTLALRQTRDGRHYYIACTRRPCEYITAYEPVLEQLRDRIARLEAELEFNRIQTRSVAENSSTPEAERQRMLTTWKDVAHRWTPRPPVDGEGRRP